MFEARTSAIERALGGFEREAVDRPEGDPDYRQTIPEVGITRFKNLAATRFLSARFR
jgi:hypothetical protein